MSAASAFNSPPSPYTEPTQSQAQMHRTTYFTEKEETSTLSSNEAASRKVLLINARGKSWNDFSTQGRETEIRISTASHHQKYRNVRPDPSRGSCVLYYADIEVGDLAPVSETTYRVGPGRPPIVKLFHGEKAEAEEIVVRSKNVFSRSIVFESSRLGKYRWRYASRGYSSCMFSKVENTMILERLEGDDGIVAVEIARMVRNAETRAKGTKYNEGNGGRLEMRPEGGDEMEALVVSASRCIVLCNKLSPSTLLAVASNLLAEKILSLAPEGSTVLVNEADIEVESALESKAHHRNINIVFTISKLQQYKNSNSVYLHPNFPKHSIQSVVPPAIVLFFHFSRGSTSDAVKVAIDKCLPSACLRINDELVLSHKVHETPGLGPSTIAKTLLSAWDDADKVNTSDIGCISLETVSNHTPLGERLAVVDWTAAESVTTKVQSINSETIFRADKTYLLVGMAGELGQSLAEWMIKHGAQCVVLSSRTPKVNPRFIEDMKKQYGAIVNSVSLDVTSRKSLQSVHAAISAPLPPIAGVINGAMVLDDELFAKMTHDQFERVTRPKVLGTQLLDEIFHGDTSLVFFIVASSIASVIGWSGQSNYSAANEYITSLVCNRRKRGVVGSAINTPAVVGVGYAAHSENFSFEYFQSLGYINISKEDLHTLFAEAILSGRPGQPESVKAQVVMGVNYIPSDLNFKEVHKRDVKFSHMIQHEENSSKFRTNRKAGLRVKVQLQSTKNPEELYTITLDSFIAHLKRMLRITEEEKIVDSATLVELGVDSLVVVDIRSWFLKELGIDVPTLKILGGAGSTGDLVRTALEKMPELQEPAAVQASRESQADMAAKPNETAQISSSKEQTSGSSPTSSGTPTSSGSPTFTPAQAASPLLSDSGSVSTTQPGEVDKNAIHAKIN